MRVSARCAKSGVQRFRASCGLEVSDILFQTKLGASFRDVAHGRLAVVGGAELCCYANDNAIPGGTACAS